MTRYFGELKKMLRAADAGKYVRPGYHVRRKNGQWYTPNEPPEPTRLEQYYLITESRVATGRTTIVRVRGGRTMTVNTRAGAIEIKSGIYTRGPVSRVRIISGIGHRVFTMLGPDGVRVPSDVLDHLDTYEGVGVGGAWSTDGHQLFLIDFSVMAPQFGPGVYDWGTLARFEKNAPGIFDRNPRWEVRFPGWPGPSANTNALARFEINRLLSEFGGVIEIAHTPSWTQWRVDVKKGLGKGRFYYRRNIRFQLDPEEMLITPW